MPSDVFLEAKSLKKQHENNHNKITCHEINQAGPVEDKVVRPAKTGFDP